MFSSLITKRKGRARASGAPGAVEDEECWEKTKKYGENTIAQLGDNLFGAMIRISRVVKKALLQFFHWSTKQVGIQNKSMSHAVGHGCAYLGPTPLSMLATAKATNFRSEMQGLLTIAAVEDPQKWAPSWELLRNDGEKAEARLLIIELVLLEAASWDHRIGSRVAELPVLLLLILERPAAECCHMRQMGAQRLLAANMRCLQALRCSDVPWKTRFCIS